MTSARRATVWSVAGLAACLVAAIGLLDLAHSPSPFLVGGLLGGVAFALLFRPAWTFPELARDLGLALVGIGAGQMIDVSVIRQLVAEPVAIGLGVIVSLIYTMLTGLVLTLSRRVNLATALFSAIAGSASGVSGIARELDADEAIVSAVQYARVVAVIGSVALVAPFLGGAAGATAAGGSSSLGLDLAFTAVCVGVGLPIARRFPFSGSCLIVPMLIATGLVLASPRPVSLPGPLLNLGYAGTGLVVGLSFTLATIRVLLRVLPLALLQLVASIGGCAAIGVAFARVVGVPDLAGYLAMTPGGLPAVAAVAVDSGATIGLVVTMQVVRVFVAILAASVLGILLKRLGGRDPAGSG